MSPAHSSGFIVQVLLLLVAVTSDCYARLLNVTVDDTYGDPRTGELPRYSGNWERVVEPGTPVAAALPDTILAFSQSLHQGGGLEDGTVSLTFEGTDVYLYIVRDLSQEVQLQFYLGDSPGPVAQYTRNSSVNTPAYYLYNELAFSATQLEYATYIVRMHVARSYRTWFDYIIYTTDDDPRPATALNPGTSPERPDAAVIAAIVAAVLSVILMIAAWFIVRRCRRRRARSAVVRRDRRLLVRSARARNDAGVPRSASRTIAAGELDAIVPFAVAPAQPTVANNVSLAPNERSQNPLKNAGRARHEELDVPAEEGARPRSESIELMRAELEQVRAENERARAENERVREENELLRRVAVPPPYSDGGSTNREDGGTG